MGKERVLEEMAREGVDVLLLGREGNARYVSGARRLFLAGERAFAPGCVVVRESGEVHLLSNTDFGIPAAIPHRNLYPTSWTPATLVARVLAIPGLAQAKTIGVDGLTPLFEALLTPEEVDLIRAAATVAKTMMTAALDAAAAGGPVKAVAMEAMASHGVTTAAFEPRVDRDGDRVTVAVGVLRDGWEADLTRSTPHAANEAIAGCRAGVAVAELGPDVHGVGLGYEVLGTDDVLEPGMVLSVGADGTRDTVLVTGGQPDVLTM